MSKQKKAGISKDAKRLLQKRKLAQLRKRQAARQKSRQAKPLRRPRRQTRSVPRPSRPPVEEETEVSEELQARLDRADRQFDRVDKSAKLGEVYDDIGWIDQALVNLPHKLTELRGRGYVHSGLLEERLVQLDEEWDNDVQPRLETAVDKSLDRLEDEMDRVERRLNALRKPTDSAVDRLEEAIEAAEEAVESAEDNLGNIYKGVKTGLDEVVADVKQVEWMIQQLDESPDIQMLEAEGPLLAVEAEWEQDGDEGPDGVLFLTDQRLLFEQKEEITTKKFLFITTDSEKVQKLLLDIPVREIEDVSHDEEGRGFMSMRKDDILELVFSAQAPISRGRFHLKGQDSSDWAIMLKRVRNGEIDDDRGDEYVEEMEVAAEMTASLPTTCPNCFADLPPQPRGVMSVTCDFCATEVTAEPPADE